MPCIRRPGRQALRRAYAGRRRTTARACLRALARAFAARFARLTRDRSMRTTNSVGGAAPPSSSGPVGRRLRNPVVVDDRARVAIQEARSRRRSWASRAPRLDEVALHAARVPRGGHRLRLAPHIVDEGREARNPALSGPRVAVSLGLLHAAPAASRPIAQSMRPRHGTRSTDIGPPGGEGYCRDRPRQAETRLWELSVLTD